MIVSHKHKFIFIKPHKTAGTSVELLLSRICGPEDVITPLGFDPDPHVREKHNARLPQNYKRRKPLKYWEMRELVWLFTRRQWPHQNYWEHLKADKIRAYVGEEIWNNYLKISIVRNPWDHAVSQFKWMLTYGFGKVNNDFTDFLKYKYQTQWDFYASYGECDIDYMIKFESLRADVIELFRKLGLSEDVDIPTTKKKSSDKASFIDEYDNATCEIVRRRNLPLLETFDYKFEKGC